MVPPLLLVLSILFLENVSAFYLPGVAPMDFRKVSCLRSWFQDLVPMPGYEGRPASAHGTKI
jgi:hypothetical protein